MLLEAKCLFRHQYLLMFHFKLKNMSNVQLFIVFGLYLVEYKFSDLNYVFVSETVHVFLFIQNDSIFY